MMKSCVLIESKNRNKYFYDRKLKKHILCHPILYFLINFLDEGGNAADLIEKSKKKEVEIDNYGNVSSEEIEYYLKKYLILKENGHFDTIDQDNLLGARLTADEIKISLANTKQITFEVTDRCNLLCEYCSYGKFYSNYDKRENIDLKTGSAKKLLRYLQKLWNSPLNRSHDSTIYIGFYGGEPLLNFDLIEELVNFAKGLKLIHNKITFSMTTNGTLLQKHMDFLVKNNFNLLISLDGNEENNEYRRYKDGRPAFPTILKNVKILKEKYPGYFKKYVNFNAVIHKKNSVSGIFCFFKHEFNKIPTIAALNTSNIYDKQKKAFRKPIPISMKVFTTVKITPRLKRRCS